MAGPGQGSGNGKAYCAGAGYDRVYVRQGKEGLLF